MKSLMSALETGLPAIVPQRAAGDQPRAAFGRQRGSTALTFEGHEWGYESVQSVGRVSGVCAALVLLALVAFIVSLLSGSVEMSLPELWRGLRSTDALSHTLVFDLRLPRALTAFAAGGVLALAGVLMQSCSATRWPIPS
jgi:ABC-type enterobactin transport system permease subunit